MNRETIQDYINNFRRSISPFLKKNVGLKSIVFPYDKGVILAFEFGINGQNKDEFRSESNSVSEAFSRAKITSFGAINNNFTFGGTNLIMDANQVVLIKDFEPKEWTDKQSKIDVNKILSPQNQPA